MTFFGNPGKNLFDNLGGKFLSNPVMHGNVMEWCSDRWHSSYDRAPSNGSSWETGIDERRRVLKGGSWYNGNSLCGSGMRHREFADICSIDSGFRVACAIADEFP